MSDATSPGVQSLTEQERHDFESTLALEFGANRRYEYQIGLVQNPRINAMLEGIKRNEGDHIDSSFQALRQTQPGTAVEMRDVRVYSRADPVRRRLGHRQGCEVRQNLIVLRRSHGRRRRAQTDAGNCIAHHLS